MWRFEIQLFGKKGVRPLQRDEVSLCHLESFAMNERTRLALHLEIRVGAEECASPYVSHEVVLLVRSFPRLERCSVLEFLIKTGAYRAQDDRLAG